MTKLKIFIFLLLVAGSMHAQKRDSIKISNNLVLYGSEDISIDDSSFTDDKSGKGGFENGVRSGEWKFYYTDKKLWKTGVFKKGKEEGEWKIYYRNGNLREITYYSNGIENGENTYYNENGKVRFKSHYENGMIEGKRTEFYESGKIKRYDEFVNGKKQGKCISYYESGQKESEEFYNNDRSEKYAGFSEDGILAEEKFNDSKGNSAEIKYHKNGKVFMKRIYNGLYLQEASFFDSNGNQLDSGTFKDGNGVLNIYNTNGILIRKLEFVNGRTKK